MTKFNRMGIDFEISSGFILLLAWLNFMDRDNILLQALVACFCHELGHIIAILYFGEEVSTISLQMIGAEIRTKSNFLQFTYFQEFICAIAGATINLLLAILFSYIPKGQLFSGLNLALALLNLLPMSQLDGGRAISCLISMYFPLSCGDLLIYCLNLFCATFLLALGVWIFLEGGTITLLFLGIWLMFSTQIPPN